MRNGREGGNFIEWLLMLLALSVVIFAILVPKNVPGGLSFGFPSINNPPSFGLSNNTNTSNYPTGPTLTSVYKDKVSLGGGTSQGAVQPSDEYVTIQNTGSTNLDITGWRVQNSVGGIGIVSQGTKILSPSGSSAVQNIVLKPGERAHVTTGYPGNYGPIQIINFKENLCTGYLDEVYHIKPQREKSCVRPIEEVGATSLERKCQDFIDGIYSCHAPKFDTIDAFGHTTDQSGKTCIGCIDGVSGLSSVCSAYIGSHYNYSGCIANHSGDKSFEGSVWHIYLYKPFEMWASSREKVYLYDATGQLAAFYSY